MQLAIVLVFLSSALGALADCCFADNGCYVVGNELICPYCDDGTLGTPCCGYGPCNIFCCNCDGGCRQSGVSAPSGPLTPSVGAGCNSTDSLFESVNADNDGFMTLDEYLAWVKTTKKIDPKNSTLVDMWTKYFHSFDVNKDGKIELHEIRH